jgi:hypothetical protein
MDYESERRNAMHYARYFGRTAIKMGFVNRVQMQEALDEQRIYNIFLRSGRGKLIGEILYENGWMTFKQIDKVLSAISKDQ